MSNPLSEVNIIVAVGSIDGMAASAACLRHSGDSELQVVFTQAFQVHTINVFQWPAKSKVGFIDLAVNNEGLNPNPQLTIEFVRKIYTAGHSIFFIADEHGKNAWKEVLETCGHSVKELSIRPKDRGEKYKSSCAVLMRAFGESADSHTVGLLRDGNEGDLMNFDTPFGRIFNEGIKSDMNSIKRRHYMIQHLAKYETPDEIIQGWIDEYAPLKAIQPKILASRIDLGDGISLYDGTIGRHDATMIISIAYKTSPIVVLKGFPESNRDAWVSISTNKECLNVLQIVREAGISASGMRAKANFALENLGIAINAIRLALRSIPK